MISQEQIIELELLQAEARHAQRRAAEYEASLLRRLKAGEAIEAGLESFRIVERLEAVFDFEASERIERQAKEAA